MKIPHRLLLAVAISTGLLASTTARADDPVYMQLFTQTGLDDLSRLMGTLPVMNNGDALTRAFGQCMAKDLAGQAYPVYARHLASGLSPEQAHHALDFLRTPPGRQLIDASVNRDLSAMQALRDQLHSAEQDDPQLADALAAFFASLTSTQSDPQVLQALQPALRQSYAHDCNPEMRAVTHAELLKYLQKAAATLNGSPSP